MRTPDAARFTGFSPYLYYHDAAAALDWLSHVFGFRENARFLDADGAHRQRHLACACDQSQLLSELRRRGRLGAAPTRRDPGSNGIPSQPVGAIHGKRPP
jgi:hypothetical protein